MSSKSVKRRRPQSIKKLEAQELFEKNGVAWDPAILKLISIREGTYLGLTYESMCELSFLLFAEELIKKKLCVKVERCPSYVLCDPVTHNYAEQLKKGSRMMSQVIQRGVTYTPDFNLIFNSSAIGKLIWVIGSSEKYDPNLFIAQPIRVNGQKLFRVCFEVKPDFDSTSTSKSVQSMKWLHQRHNVLVNLFKPDAVFERTFMPLPCQITKAGKLRKLKFKPRTINEFINSGFVKKLRSSRVNKNNKKEVK